MNATTTEYDIDDENMSSDDNFSGCGYSSDQEELVETEETEETEMTEDLFSDPNREDYPREEADKKIVQFPQAPYLARRSSSTLTGEESSSDSSMDSLLWKHRYLSKKCSVLKRASDVMNRDDVFAASVAKKVASTTPNDDSKLWNEARALLTELHGPRSPPAKRVRLMEPPRNRRPGIDLRFVHQFSSKAMDDDTKKILVPEPMPYNDSQWMGRTMSQLQGVRAPRVSSDEEDDSGSKTRQKNLGMLSPNLVSAGPIGIEEALQLTSTAQLLAQAIPPFAILHANRAFYELSGQSTGSTIGNPIENVVKLSSNDHDTQDDDGRVPACLMAQWNSSESKQQPCEIRVLSVKGANSTQLTHVLVQVYASSADQEEEDLEIQAPLKENARRAAMLGIG